MTSVVAGATVFRACMIAIGGSAAPFTTKTNPREKQIPRRPRTGLYRDDNVRALVLVLARPELSSGRKLEDEVNR